MNWWQRLWQRHKLEEQLDKEMRFHLDQHAADLVARGFDVAQARRQARLGIGGAEQVKEECRDARGTRWLEDLAKDLRYAARTLRQRPGFTIVGAITLALGIGASTAIFSALNPVLFESLPYPHAGRVMMIWDTYQGSRSAVTFQSYRELSARSRAFESMAVIRSWQPTITSDTRPERLAGQRVSAGYFRTLGVAPAWGRDFRTGDDRYKGPRVIILSEPLWQRRFHGDTSIVGRQITLDGELFTVLGVMPKSFENVLAPAAELWMPLQYDAANVTNLEGQEWGHHLQMLGRLRPGVTVDQARHELNAIGAAPVREYLRPPWASLRFGLIVNSLQSELAREVKPVLLAVSGAVVLLLLIASVNVTNLMLARTAQRRGEFSMRAALGASRPRLIRQMLAESLLLAMLGGALGILVASLGVQALTALGPAGLPRLQAIAINGPVFAFALALTTCAGLLSGLVPALHASRADLGAGIQQGSRRTAGGRQATRRALVVSEVALAIILLIGAGLLLRSLARLFAVPPGFDPSHLLTMDVQYTGHRYNDGAARRAFLTQTLDAVHRVPGVTPAAFTSLLPFRDDPTSLYGAHFEDGRVYDAFRYAVTSTYWATMGIQLRRGRLLDDHDNAAAPLAVVISESLARDQFPGRDPIGKRVHLGPEKSPWFTIVGVAGDVKQSSLGDSRQHAFYMTPAQSWFNDDVMSLVVRGRADVTALIPAVKNAVWSVDKDQPIVQLATMESLVADSESQRRFAMIAFEAFALVALVLAGTGIYGILSGQVNERTREIGVRSALGASRGDILALVVRQGLALTGLGVVLGVIGAAAASRALVSLLYGVSRLDAVTYLGVIVLLSAVSVLACFAPAWRAARVDPAITLRSE